MQNEYAIWVNWFFNRFEDKARNIYNVPPKLGDITFLHWLFFLTNKIQKDKGIIQLHFNNKNY